MRTTLSTRLSWRVVNQLHVEQDAGGIGELARRAGP
jgi:hypothetical protein